MRLTNPKRPFAVRIRPFLMLYRFRLILASVLSILAALLLLFVTSAEGLTDFGVLWHHFCGCAPEDSDATLLLNVSTGVCVCLGLVMGTGVGVLGGGQAARGGAAPVMVYGGMRFLLTRPLKRSEVLLLPVAMAVLVILVFPAAGLLLLLTWLRLVHAPALGHLVDIARLVPGAAGIGSRPSLVAVLAATHFGRFYAASVSVGLCVFALYYVPRWWIHSELKWVRVASALTALMPATPFLLIHAHRSMAWMFLMSRLGTEPSLPAIAIHAGFAAVLLGSCWRIAQRVEL